METEKGWGCRRRKKLELEIDPDVERSRFLKLRTVYGIFKNVLFVDPAALTVKNIAIFLYFVPVVSFSSGGYRVSVTRCSGRGRPVVS